MLEIPENSIIYCDPPYINTSYKYNNSFCHATFWNWCREKAYDGHDVFISEYTAPEDFECLTETNCVTNMYRNSKLPRVEKLFRFKNDKNKEL